MIAPLPVPRSGCVGRQYQDQFVEMLPKIRRQARLAFRRLRTEQQEEMVQEVVANAFCAFVRLVHRGKVDIAYPTPLAKYAIGQVLEGRKIGAQHNIRDVMSPQARRARRIVVERLDNFDEAQGQWRAALIEDRRSTPAEIAAARIDVAAWLRSLPARNRRIAKTLAMGETTCDVAQQFHVSPARISQLRKLFQSSWETFHDGGKRRA